MPRRNRYKAKQPKREPTGMTFELSSGFEVFVTPLPPYYKDIIFDRFPLRDYPKYMFETLAGDKVPWPYKPPEEMPDPDEDQQGWELYMQWHAVDEFNKDQEKRRERAKIDFLIANCVTIRDGPYDIEDTEWMDRVEAAFPGMTVPEHAGECMLLFLKTQVITTVDEAELIMESCTSPEVSAQGIRIALENFRRNMERQESERVDGGTRRPSKAQHEVVGD